MCKLLVHTRLLGEAKIAFFLSLVKTRLFNPMLQISIYTTIIFNQNHLWQHLSSISDPPRSERTKRPTSYTTCLTPPAKNSNGCAADTHRTAGVARLEELRFHGAKWGHFAICHLFLPSGISLPFFFVFSPPPKPPPMNRCRTYHLMNPLTGIWPAYENALGYRYASPDGDGLPHGISAIPSLTHLLFTVH